MKSIKKHQVQANSMITRLEDLLLSAPSSELRAASRVSGAVDPVRRIIAEQIASNEGRGSRPSARQGGRDTLPAGVLPRVSPASHARAIFGKDGTSAQDKVEELISNLSKDRKDSKGSTKK